MNEYEAAQKERRDKEAEEKRLKAVDAEFVKDALRSMGISMKVEGCGCCGSPSVKFTFDDTTVEHDYFCFDTEEFAS